MTQTAQEFTRAASLLKAMAHPERLAILFRLACGAQNLDELANTPACRRASCRAT